MRLQHTVSRDSTGTRGATLIVTLGILTVISVMVVTFLVASRLQRQTVAGDQNRLVARNYMDAALQTAMRQIEDSLTYPNYTDDDIETGEYLTSQRVAPVGRWFSTRHDEAYPLNRDVSYQARDVLASPTLAEGPPPVNLITPQVMRLIPSVLTNGLQLSSHQKPTFRSGWIPLDLLPTNAPVDMRLRSKSARTAFAVFNCSGFIDANHFLSGPTTQKLPRVCFSQADVTNWVEAAQTKARLDDLKIEHDPRNSPFFPFSYDPDPDVYPLDYDCFETCPALGRYRFGSYPVVNLNVPGYYQALSTLKAKATYWKFNLNSLTNHLELGTESTDTTAPWFNDAAFRAGWLDPVVFLMNMMLHEEPPSTLHRWRDSSALAWSIANFMDQDRFPQVSDFPTSESAEPELATRANYAVEDVPLINKVTVFNIFDPDQPGTWNPDAPKAVDLDHYFDGNPSNLSNHYAVAVELWYPFAPNLPPLNTACYIGIYTNGLDVQTTTNRPWSANELRDWFKWNNIDQSNSVMRTLFYSWANAYTAEVGPSLENHPLWQAVTDQGDLWFTPGMTNHPSWPVADTNGVFSITNTPVWQAFYPDTYEVVSTNGTGSVTTNVYTYLNVTNSYAEWVSEPDMQTNRLTGPIGTTEPEPFPVLLWSNLTTSALITNVLGAVLTPEETLIPFYSPGVTNHLQSFTVSPDGIDVTLSNELTGVVATYPSASFVLAPWSTNELLFALATNLTVTTEVLPVEPLPMPEDLGLALSALFLMLPADSLSSLYTFLMLTPDEFSDDMWRDLLDYFSENPSVFNRLMPSHQEPTLGFMTEEDRHVLEDESYTADNGKVEVLKKLQPSEFQGCFWTVYPKRAVSFMEVVEEAVDESGTVTQPASTNYHALGNMLNGKRNTIWLRPVTTVNRNGTDTPPEEDLTQSDVIVDEALLSRGGENDGIPVRGWTSVTNLCIPEPRNNAYAHEWRGFDEPWDQVVNTTNLNTGVSELPFIHFNVPFSTVGDIGHIYASYTQNLTTAESAYDTLTFSTRSGAALLDIFTLSPTNGPRRGLVQANTLHAPVLQTLLSDVHIGWTNNTDTTGWKPLFDSPDSVEGWANVYADSLTNAPYSMGWRSFADMLPMLSTNRLFRQENVWGGIPDLHPMHDYTEDVLRGLVGKVSFRQNVFVIVVAAQTLSPASTENNPVVLSDQRAAVTVLRDAYTGRWTLYNWLWLTE